MNPSRKRITLRDLAEELGVSGRTVSQALNPRQSNVKLSPATAERIRKLAEERGYQPDSRARSMRYGRFFNLGYFEAKKTAHAWPLLGAESGVFDAAIEHNYRVVLIRLPSDLASEPGSIPSIFREGNLDALILSHAGNLSAAFEEVIDVSGFPVVYMNEKKRYNAVYSDDFQGAGAITNHLIAEGHRKIVYLTPSDGEIHYSVMDRKSGYLNAMSQAGLAPSVLDYAFTSPWENLFLQWFEQNSGEIDAIICVNDFLALQTLRILYAHRKSFPRDVSITGFDDLGREMSPLYLTTMRVPFYEMGRAAVEMALELVNQNKSRIQSRVFQNELIVRGSTKKR